MILAAYTAYSLKLCARIQSPVFCGVRYIYHTGHYHVIVITIVIIPLKHCSYVRRVYFPVIMRQRHDLVTAEFYRTCLVSADMARFSCDNALIAFKKRIYNCSVSLSAAHKEMHICIRSAALRAYLFFSAAAVFIEPVARSLYKISFHKALHDSRMRPFHIVACKK